MEVDILQVGFRTTTTAANQDMALGFLFQDLSLDT
jgi:hypothetical protein